MMARLHESGNLRDATASFEFSLESVLEGHREKINHSRFGSSEFNMELITMGQNDDIITIPRTLQSLQE
jgi:hypothetical protein